jgi:hypothetical protein
VDSGGPGLGHSRLVFADFLAPGPGGAAVRHGPYAGEQTAASNVDHGGRCSDGAGSGRDGGLDVCCP